MTIYEKLHTAMSEVLKKLGAGEVVFSLEHPGDSSHGDFATNAALASAKVLGKNPREVANDFMNEFAGMKISEIESVEIHPFIEVNLLHDCVSELADGQTGNVFSCEHEVLKEELSEVGSVEGLDQHQLQCLEENCGGGVFHFVEELEEVEKLSDARTTDRLGFVATAFFQHRHHCAADVFVTVDFFVEKPPQEG